jgi:hypothetical protein
VRQKTQSRCRHQDAIIAIAPIAKGYDPLVIKKCDQKRVRSHWIEPVRVELNLGGRAIALRVAEQRDRLPPVSSRFGIEGLERLK